MGMIEINWLFWQGYDITNEIQYTGSKNTVYSPTGRTDLHADSAKSVQELLADS